MSHAVRIDYQGISIQCQSICEMASKQLCKLDRMLDEIEKESTRLLGSQTEAFRKDIAKTRAEIQSKIDSVLATAKKNASMGRITVDSDFMGKHSNAYGVVEEANQLKQMVLNLESTKIIEFESLLNHLLNSNLQEHNQKLQDLADGKIRLNLDVQQKILAIEDSVVQQYVYLAWVNHPEENFDKLYEIAITLKNKNDEEQYKKSEQKKINEIQEELKSEKIDDATIEKIISVKDGNAKERIQKIQEQANNEIVGEKIRKESVKIIVKAIKQRGFIVDAKSIKIDREKNLVNILAQKPDGAKAEFKVFLDGKFEYRFDGYEGQACQKDIQPFMKDLEDIYGIKVMNQVELWGGNPDKISNMKYQTVNHKSNRG